MSESNGKMEPQDPNDFDEGDEPLDRPPRYRLVLENRGRAYRNHFTRQVYEIEGEELAVLIKEAIEKVGGGRTDLTVAWVAVAEERGVGEGGSWPGHLKALDDLVDAANRIIEGWEKHDEVLEEAERRGGGKEMADAIEKMSEPMRLPKKRKRAGGGSDA